MKYILFLVLCFPVFAQTHDEVVATVIIREAGGEGLQGMQAVANVIQNRAKNGKSFYDVVTRRHQFESLSPALVQKSQSMQALVDRAKRHRHWNLAKELVNKMHARNLPDITKGSTHFHADYMTPYWAKIIPFKVQVGAHRFYKEGR